MNILDTIGNTPVVPLKHLVTDGMAKVYGKYEAGNPTYSLKDRIALAIVEDLESRAVFALQSELVVASNGNSGISMAMVCAVKGYALHLFMSENVTAEKKLIPQSYGAIIHEIAATNRFETVIEAAQKFVAEQSNSVFINQFNSDASVAAHAKTTAQEIIADFPDGVDAFVSSVGTAGSIAGISQVLAKKWPQILICAVEPASSAVLSGAKPGTTRIQQIGLGFVPPNYHKAKVSRVITVTDQDAYDTVQALSRNEGLLLGISSGANVWASLQVARELGPQKKVLTLLCDQGQRYFSLQKLFNQQPLTGNR